MMFIPREKIPPCPRCKRPLKIEIHPYFKDECYYCEQCKVYLPLEWEDE